MVGVKLGNSGTEITSGVGALIDGTYGNLVMNATGGYSYVLDTTGPGYTAIQALDTGETALEYFTYTIIDNDGDKSTAVLTITINGANDAPVIGTDTSVVSEEGLLNLAGTLDNGIQDSAAAAGFTDVSNSASDLTGHVNVTDVDGEAQTLTLGIPLQALTADGVTVIWSLSLDGKTLTGTAGVTPVITVTIADNGDYSVNLLQSIDHPVKGLETAGEDTLNFVVPVTANDGSGPVTNLNAITVTIEDDSPDAVNDTASATEGPTATIGNVLSNDPTGADTPAAVTFLNGSAIALNGSASVTTAIGTLVLGSNGAYTYTPNASVAAGTVDSFTYTMRDADGDTSTATLTITFTGDVNVPTASNVTAAVDDEGLTGGILGGTAISMRTSELRSCGRR